jgi:hypothetical protein
MDLKKLSKKTTILNDAVTVWMLPYRTRKAGYQFEVISEMFSADLDEWDDYQCVFLWVEQHAVDMTFPPAKGENPHLAGLRQYWHGRNGDEANNWELFSNVISRDVLYALHDAYTETREDLPGAPEILTEGRPDKNADPEGSSGGE